MNRLISIHNSAFNRIEAFAGSWLLPTFARFAFAAVLFVYFFNSAMLKLGEGVFGIFSPSLGAYAAIFPRAMEAAGFDTSQLSAFHWLVVVAGTAAEIILPILIVIGLLTRLAALGMIGFIFIQSLTDLYGHGGIEHEGTLGAWFDRLPDALILDQRLFWVLILVVMIVKGAGPVSLDALFRRRKTD